MVRPRTVPLVLYLASSASSWTVDSLTVVGRSTGVGLALSGLLQATSAVATKTRTESVEIGRSMDSDPLEPPGRERVRAGRGEAAGASADFEPFGYRVALTGMANMTIESAIRLLAGSLILISIALYLFVSPWWLLLAGFVGLNLTQSALTGFCPAEVILKRLRAIRSARGATRLGR